MIKAGIIGAAGYTAGELIRILVNHPDVEISFAQSSSSAGRKVWGVQSGLYGDCDREAKVRRTGLKIKDLRS